MSGRSLLVGLVAAIFSMRGHAATATLTVGNDTYTVNTGHSGGTCHVKDLAADGVDVDCEDSDGHRAYANSRKGCIVTSIGGTCGLRQPADLRSYITAVCGHTTYVIGSEDTRTSCRVDYNYAGNATRAICDDKRDNREVLDCSKNGGEGACDSTSGSGACLTQ